MNFSLLDFILCPHCRKVLSAYAFQVDESNADFDHFCRFWCAAKSLAVNPEVEVGPDGLFPPHPEMNFENPGKIDRKDCRRCFTRNIVEGILVCTECGRFFPIRESIPEVLPGPLRDVSKDRDFLNRNRNRLPESMARKIDARGFALPGDKGEGEELTYKKAEMALTQREDITEGFFGPGHVAPFEPQHPVRAVEKIIRFTTALHHLNLRSGDPALDLGVGYAWTTEWMNRMGFRTIGVDINRDYLRVGLTRTGGRFLPLLIADVEDLPLRKRSFQGAVFFDSFHHISGRERCIRRLSTLLGPGGRVILAEPGLKHASHPRSIQVMDTYGILEKGTSKKELKRLIKGTSFEKTENFAYGYGDVEMILIEMQGSRAFTSLGPDHLRADVRLESKSYRGLHGSTIPVELEVENTGNTIWLKESAEGIGMVRVGFQLRGLNDDLLDENYFRISLPQDINPGEKVSLRAELPLPSNPGGYRMEIDLVSEGIIWFKDIEYNPVCLDLRVD